MNKWILALFLGAAAIGLAWAQTVPSPGPPIGIACAYNASPPTLTTGTAGWVQCDSTGGLITSGGGGGGGAVTIADGADVTQGAKADAAWSSGDGTTISILKKIAGNTAAISGTVAATQSGTWTVQPGNTANTTAWLVSISQGGNTAAVVTAGADGVSNTLSGAVNYSRTSCWNGATWDRCTQLTSGTATAPSSQYVSVNAAPGASPIPVISGGSAYETVAASQTGQALGATGAIGDYLSHCTIYPTSTTPGVVTVFDNTNAAGTNVIAFPGGASSVSNLAPVVIAVGAISVAGAWKVTTGANLVVTCYGKFT